MRDDPALDPGGCGAGDSKWSDLAVFCRKDLLMDVK